MSRRIHCSLVAVIILTQTLLPVMSYAQGPVGRATLDGAAFSSSASINDAGYLYFKGDFGDRIGSNGPVFSAGAFLPYFFADETVGFADGRIAINEGELGFNGGLGLRTIFGNSAVAGGSFWVDTQDSQNGAQFTQLGVSGEMLLNRVEFRANGYFNVGRERNNFGIIQTGRFTQAPNGNPSFVDIQLFETSPSGGDVEVGVPLPGYEWMSLHGGAYFYDEVNGDEIAGVRVRLEAQVSDDIMWELRYTNDDETGSSLNAAVSMLLSNRPLGLVPRYQRQGPRQRLVRQVVRQYRPAIFVGEEDVLVPATAPGGGPLGIIVVDASAAPGGDGSFANPFNAFSGSSTNANTFFVRNGGTSATNPLISTFNLLPGQSLIGEGQPLTVNTSRGVFTVPGTGGGGPGPFITHPTGDVVTLSNNNTVNGINFISSTGNSAISGANINTPLNILNSTFAGTGGGLNFTNLSGPQSLSNLAFAMDPNASGPAINVANTNTNPLQFNVTDTTITGGLSGIALSGDNSIINSVLNNVNNSGSGDGLVLNTTNGGNINITKNGGSFNNTTGNGTANGDAISATADTGSLINFQTFNSNFDMAFRDVVNVTSTNGSNIIGKLTGGSALMPGRRDLTQTVSGGSNSLVNFDPFTTSQGGDNAVEFFITDNSTGTVIYDQIDANGALLNGIFGLVDNNSSGVLISTGSNFANAGQSGLNVTVSNNSTLTADLSNSNFSGAQNGSAVQFTVDNSSGLNLTMNNINGTNASQNGLDITATNGSTVTVNNNTNDFSGAGGNGVNLVANNSVINYTGTATTANGVGGTGFGFNAQAGSFIGITSNGGMFNNAGADAANGFVSNSSTVNFELNNAMLNMAGSDGIELDVASDGNLTATINTGSIDNATLDAINANITGVGSNATINIAGTSADMAGGDGFDFHVDSVGLLNSSIGNTTFTNAGGYGLTGNVDGPGSIGNLTLSDVTASNGGNGGLFLSATNQGDLNATVIRSAFDNSVTGPSIWLSGNNGFLDLNMSGIASSANAAAHGLNISALNNSVFNVTIDDTDLSGAGNDGAQILVDSSILDLTLTNTTMFGAGTEGLDLDVINGSTFTGNITNGNFSNAAGGDGVNANITGASIANLTLTNTNANNAAGNGFEGTNDGSTFNLNLTNSSGNMAAGAGIWLNTINGGTTVATVVDSSFDDAMGGQAINLGGDNGNVTFDLSGTSSAQRASQQGLNIQAFNNSTFDVDIAGSSFDNAGNDGVQINSVLSTVDLDLNNTSANMVGGEGLDIDALNGDVTVTGTNGGFNNATGDGISINHVGSGTTWLTLNGTSANMPGIQGLDLDANGPGTVNVNITNGGFDDATNDDAINILGQNGSTINFTMLGTSAERAGFDGIDYDILSGSTFVGSITNGSFNNAGLEAIEGTASGTGSSATLTVENTDGNNSSTGLLLTAQSSAMMNTTVNNSNFNNNTSNTFGAIDQLVTTGANASLTLNNVNAQSAAGDGVTLLANNGQIDFTYSGGNITGAGFSAFDVDALNGGTINSFNLVNVLADNAGTFGIDLDADNGTFNGIINGGSLTNAGQAATANSADALNISAINGSNVNLTINDTPLNDTQGTATQENSVLFDVRSGSTLDLNILNTVATPNTTLLSNNTEDGVNGFITGAGSTVNLTLDGARVDNNTDDGLDFNLEDQGTLNFVFNSTNNQGTIHGNGDDGVAVRAVGAGGMADTPATLTFNGIDFSANGGQTIDLNPQNEAPPAPRDGGTVNLVFNNSTIANNNLTNIIVNDPNSPVALHFNNTAIPVNPTGPGIGFTVTNGAMFTLSLENTAVSGNGLAGGTNGQRAGIEGSVSGAGSTANLLFTNVDISNNAEQGLDLDINNGGVVNYTNTATYNNNGAVNAASGMRVLVDGAGSDFNGTFNGTTANSNTLDGFEFAATNGADFSANMTDVIGNFNGRDGLQLDAVGANDVDLILLGNSGQFTQNAQDGVDVLASTLNSFDLGLSTTGSNDQGGDGFNLFLTNIATGTVNGTVTASGNAASGFDLTINNSTITDFALTGLTADNNAVDGVVINLDNTTINNFSSTGLSASGNQRGFVLDANNGTTIAGGTFDGQGGSISNNTAGPGILLDVDNSNVEINFSNLSLDTNIGTGFVANTSNGATLTSTITNSTISNNVGFGIFTTQLPNSTLNLNLGTAGNGNLITNNRDGGALLAYQGTGSTFSTLNIVENTFSPGFGDAITIGMFGDSELVNSTISGNTISDYTGAGINFFTAGNPNTTNFNIVGNAISNVTTGVNMDIDVNGAATDNGIAFGFNGNTVTGSTVGAGFDLNVPNGRGVSVTSFDNNVFNNNAGGGSNFHASGGGGGVNFASFNNNTYSGNTGTGVSFTLEDNGTSMYLDSFDGNTIGTSGNGVDVDTDDMSTMVFNRFNTSNVNGNTNGLVIDAADMSLVAFTQINGTNFNSNTDGVLINATDTAVVNFTSIDGTTLNQNTSNGFDINQTGVSRVWFGSINNSTISNSTAAGFDADLDNNSAMVITNITDSNFTNNDGGLMFDLDNFSRLEINGFSGNDVSNNTDIGLLVDAFNQTTFTLNIGDSSGNQNTFNANVDAGLGILQPGTLLGTTNISDGELTVVNSTFTNTTNSGTNANFDGEGLGITVGDLADLNNIVIGDAAINNTTFSGNANQGIEVDIFGAALFQNATFQNLTVTGNTGDGLDIARDGDAQITGVTINNSTFTQNSDGVSIFAENTNSTDTYTFTNNTVDNNNNNGLALRSEADADIDILVQNNFFRGNAVDGVNTSQFQLDGTDTPSVDFTGLTNGNTFTGNGDDGVELSAFHNTIRFGEDSDASALGTADNIFSGNTGNGLEVNIGDGFASTSIILVEDADFIGNTQDGANVSASGVFSVQRSEVTGNMDDGLQITSRSGNINFNNISTNMNDGLELRVNNHDIFNNVVDSNQNNGFNLNENIATVTFNGGTNRIINNQITQNTNDAIQSLNPGTLIVSDEDLDRDGVFDPGEDFDGDGNFDRFEDANGNGILDGGEDLDGDGELDLGNFVRFNNARGIEVIRRLSGTSQVNVDGNTIRDNNFEALYVINTTDSDQAQSGLSLGTNGSAGATPTLALNVDGNLIRDNGAGRQGSAADGTGIVLFLSTTGRSGADSSFADSDGVFSTGFDDPTGFDVDKRATLANRINGRSGAQVSITSNRVVGQFGNDLDVNVYKSNNDPSTTVGTWTDNNDNPRNNANDIFTVNSYQGDALLRLDMNIDSNIFDGVSLINQIGSLNYTNNEAVFKSRTSGQDGNDPPGGFPDDGGPFSSGTRARNAVRTAARNPANPGLTIIGASGSSDNFLYPGQGTSTIQSTKTTGGFIGSNTITVGGGGAFGGVNGVPWIILP